MTALVITRPGPVVPRRYTFDDALRPVRVEDDHGNGGVTTFEPAALWTPEDVLRETEERSVSARCHPMPTVERARVARRQGGGKRPGRRP